VLLLGEAGEFTPSQGLGGSEYLKRVHGQKTGACPRLNLAGAVKLNGLCLELIRAGLVRSAHDCAEGGLAVALAECAISNDRAAVGATIDLRPLQQTYARAGYRLDALLYGETQSRIVLTCDTNRAEEIIRRATQASVPVTALGTTGGAQLAIQTASSELRWELAALRESWWHRISRLMDQ
jgi:phosphoribosylformylglycinamidine synthase